MPEPFIGEIKLVPYNFAPRGWMFCAGQVLQISSYQALFSLLGVTYGGDGRTTFALPDLRGRVPVSFGQGPGLDHYGLGMKGGLEQVTLHESQMPAHTHTAELSNAETAVACSTGAGTSNTPSPTSVLAQGSVKKGREDIGDANIYNESTPDTTLTHSAVSGSVAVSSTGGNFGHENRQPYTVLNYIIALEGVYPSRS